MVKANKPLYELRDDTPGVTRPRGKLNPAQKKHLEKLQREWEAMRDQRIEILAERFLNRIHHFMEASHSSITNEVFFEIRRFEAEFLALECFGIDLLHRIGLIYIQKANACLRSGKLLGLGGVWFKSKEHGTSIASTLGKKMKSHDTTVHSDIFI
jgi:hypothetical protein